MPHHPLTLPFCPSLSCSSSLLFFWFNPPYFCWFEQEGKEGWREGKAYYPSFSALNYLNANDVRGRAEGGGQETDDGRETLRENGRESECVGSGGWAVEGGLICCCSGCPGAVWLWKIPPSCALTLCPQGQSNWSQLFTSTRGALTSGHWPTGGRGGRDHWWIVLFVCFSHLFTLIVLL